MRSFQRRFEMAFHGWMGNGDAEASVTVAGIWGSVLLAPSLSLPSFFPSALATARRGGKGRSVLPAASFPSASATITEVDLKGLRDYLGLSFRRDPCAGLRPGRRISPGDLKAGRGGAFRAVEHIRREGGIAIVESR
jgi:hypothetical protein